MLVLQEAPEDPFDPAGQQLWQVAAYANPSAGLAEGVCLTGRYRTAEEALDALDLHEQISDLHSIVGALGHTVRAVRRHVDTLRVVVRVLVRAAESARLQRGALAVDLDPAKLALTEARYRADENGDGD